MWLKCWSVSVGLGGLGFMSWLSSWSSQGCAFVVFWKQNLFQSLQSLQSLLETIWKWLAWCQVLLRSGWSFTLPAQTLYPAGFVRKACSHRRAWAKFTLACLVTNSGKVLCDFHKYLSFFVFPPHSFCRKGLVIPCCRVLFAVVLKQYKEEPGEQVGGASRNALCKTSAQCVCLNPF